MPVPLKMMEKMMRVARVVGVMNWCKCDRVILARVCERMSVLISSAQFMGSNSCSNGLAAMNVYRDSGRRWLRNPRWNLGGNRAISAPRI
jgi:hypothetical protein